MKFENVSIEAMEHYLPELIVTSNEIEERLSPLYERLKLPLGRLELMTGIQERRLWPIGTRPSELSTIAAKSLIEKNDIDKNSIDLIIHASVCRDFLEPSTASVVHSNLELNENCEFFDLSNACLGVVNGIFQASRLIEAGMIHKALIVSGENAAPLLEETIKFLNSNTSLTRKSVKKYIANLTIGSGACAYLISRATDERKKIHHIVSMVDSKAHTLCSGDGDTSSLMMETESEELLKAGIALAKSTWNKYLNETKLSSKDIGWFVGHQVGKAHDEGVRKSLGLEGLETFVTYPFLGNTGSAALPMTFSILEKEELLKIGDEISMVGIGSGLNCMSMGVKW